MTISYDNFISHFHLVEINYFKNFTEENNVKIENKETMRCQIIEITNEHDNNEIIINLYQKSNVNRVFSYLLLIKKEKNLNAKDNSHLHRYKDSITSHKDNYHESHICLKVIPFEKGTYYLCCDINYRFLIKQDKKGIEFQDYLIKLKSKKKSLLKTQLKIYKSTTKLMEFLMKQCLIYFFFQKHIKQH